MMATCRGVFSRSTGVSTRRSAGSLIRTGNFLWAGFSRASYLEELGFLVCQGSVDAFGVLVGHLLKLDLRPVLFLLGVLASEPYQLLPALLGKLGDGKP